MSLHAHIRAESETEKILENQVEPHARAPTSVRRVVFIDFDGVTHATGAPAGQMLPFEWVPILAQLLVAHPDVGVVVHSSWREQFGREYLQDFLAPLGGQFVGAAPPGRKAAAIEQYLRAYPEIEHSLVLDDEPDHVANIAGVAIVACHPWHGISCIQVQERIMAWLNRRVDPRQ